MATDFGFTQIHELAEAYRRGDASPVEVVDSLLDRIERLDAKLGAWQVVYADEARQAARAAEAAIRSGHRIGPFHGVPFALKDIVDLEGRITTGGSEAMRDRVSPTTATIARRLTAAGGVLIGKTKTVEVAMGGWGTNQRMGTPWNPWDAEVKRTPGGSSSGSGVAVAAGMAACAVGTDTGGSVRLPASWCGIVGLKVTEGRLPTDGILPLSHTLDTPGPMTRGVMDAVQMFEVMDGRHPADTEADWLAGDGLFAMLTRGIAGLRLGSLPDAERAAVDAETLRLYDASLATLAGLGAEIAPFAPPLSFDALKDGSGILIASEGYHHQGWLYEQNADSVDEDVRPRIMGGREIGAKAYIAACLRRKQDQADFLAHMRGFDAVLTPTTPTAAVPVDTVDQTSTPAHFTRAANYLGMCGLSLPNGLTSDGLPGSLQIMARPHDEAMAIRVGAAFEAAIDPIGRPPMA